jgi:tryptophan halogenase
MGKPITNITIVGGGTAGWITAAYLNHRLQWGATATREVAITVIESPDVGTIGVGEATVPTLKQTLQMLQISEAEFVQRTDATFKLGIWFKDWNREADGKPVGYIHPFTGGMTVLGHNPGYSFKKYGMPGREKVSDQDFVRTISSSLIAMEMMRGPRAIDGPEFGGALQYAYHIDAGKLANFLEEVCIARGVKHIRDNVLDVRLDDRGFISSLQLKENGEWPIELVIDCTGFQGLLINKTLKEPFESYSDYLLNDRAIPIQIKHDDAQALKPVTTCTALKAGWSWNIPLQSRVGTGYVFSSAFTSEDAALDEFREYLGEQARDANPRVLKMRVGRTRRSWVKNCIAIGLSSGFIEPLESTAIMSVELMARWVLHTLPTTDFEEPLIEQFNTRIRDLYEEVRDFLSIHFSQSDRDDTPYWKAVRHEAKRSDNLNENLSLWKYSLPSPINERKARVFNSWSVQCLLMGKNFYRDANLIGEELVPPPIWEQYVREIQSERNQVLNRIADHRRLVDHMCSQKVSGSAIKVPRPFQSVIGGPMTVAPQPLMEARGA